MVFVDDILITGPNTKALKNLQIGLKTKFKIKIVKLATYLDLHIEREENYLRLYQASYTRRILTRFSFDNTKKVSTLMTNHSLCSNGGESDIDIEQT